MKTDIVTLAQLQLLLKNNIPYVGIMLSPEKDASSIVGQSRRPLIGVLESLQAQTTGPHCQLQALVKA